MNLKVHYHIYSSPTPVHILNQINPVHGDTEFYAEIFWNLYSVIMKIISLILKL